MSIELIFGRQDGDRVVFGPLAVHDWGRSADGRVDFVAAMIDLWVDGECKVRLDDRNGIEALSLRHLRDSLVSLRDNGRGTAYFGDHDFGEIVDLEARPDGTMSVRANFPSQDIWELDLPPMDSDDTAKLIGAIDAAEAIFGDLVGYCEGCGIPPATYRETWP